MTDTDLNLKESAPLDSRLFFDQSLKDSTLDPDFGQQLTKYLGENVLFKGREGNVIDSRTYLSFLFLGMLFSVDHSDISKKMKLFERYWYFDQTENRLKMVIIRQVGTRFKLIMKCVDFSGSQDRKWSADDVNEILHLANHKAYDYEVELHWYNVIIENTGEQSTVLHNAYVFLTEETKKVSFSKLPEGYKAETFTPQGKFRTVPIEVPEEMKDKNVDLLSMRSETEPTNQDKMRKLMKYVHYLLDCIVQVPGNSLDAASTDAQCGILYGILLNFPNAVSDLMVERSLSKEYMMRWRVKSRAEENLYSTHVVGFVSEDHVIVEGPIPNIEVSRTMYDMGLTKYLEHSGRAELALVSFNTISLETVGKKQPVEFVDGIQKITDAIDEHSIGSTKRKLVNHVDEFLQRISSQMITHSFTETRNYLSSYVTGLLSASPARKQFDVSQYKTSKLGYYLGKHNTGFVMATRKANRNIVINVFERASLDKHTRNLIKNKLIQFSPKLTPHVEELIFVNIFVIGNDNAEGLSIEYSKSMDIETTVEYSKLNEMWVVENSELEELPIFDFHYHLTSQTLENSRSARIENYFNNRDKIMSNINSIKGLARGLLHNHVYSFTYDRQFNFFHLSFEYQKKKLYSVFGFGAERDVAWDMIDKIKVLNQDVPLFTNDIVIAMIACKRKADDRYSIAAIPQKKMHICDTRRKRNIAKCIIPYSLDKFSPASNKVLLLEDEYKFPLIDPLGYAPQKNYLRNIERISNSIMIGMMSKNLIIDIMHGNIVDIGMNVAFIVSGPAFGMLADKIAASAKTSTALKSGVLKVGSSFLRRAASFLFVGYDLIKSSIKYYKHNDSSALLNVKVDAAYISIDLAETGIEIAEVSGLIAGVSAVANPFGLALGAVLFVSTDVYSSFKKVEAINSIIHLSKTERFFEGVRAFFGLDPEQHIEDVLDEKKANDEIIMNAMNFLRDNKQIKRYILPIVVIKNEHIYAKRKCWKYFPIKCLFSKTTVSLKKTLNLQSPKIIDLHERRSKFKIIRSISEKSPRGTEYFCIPPGGSLGVTNHLLYIKCVNSIGLENVNANSTNNTYILLNSGDDIVRGFLNSENIFDLTSGHKTISGGNHNDRFILRSGSLSGYLHGYGGRDILDVSAVLYDIVYVNQSYVHTSSHSIGLYLESIEELYGRSGEPDIVECWCSAHQIGLQGGNKTRWDEIRVPPSHCEYNVSFYVGEFTLIENWAEAGIFKYYTLNSQVIIKINSSGNSVHEVYLHISFPDLISLDVTELKEDSQSFFILKTGNKSEIRIQTRTAKYVKLIFKDGVYMDLGKEREIAKLDTKNTAEQEIAKYAGSVASSTISLVIHSRFRNETVVLSRGMHTTDVDYAINIMHNNPNHDSHLIGSLHENIYIIRAKPVKKIDELSVNVTVYISNHPNQTSLIDFDTLTKEISHIHPSGSFFIRTIIVDSHNIDMILCITDETKSVKQFGRVVIVGVLEKDLYKTITIMHGRPLKIRVETNDTSEITKIYLAPYPITFDSENIIVLTTNDISDENIEIRINKTVERCEFYSLNDSLILSNVLFVLPYDSENAFFLIFQNFKNHSQMQTSVISLNNRKIYMENEKQQYTMAKSSNYLTKRLFDQQYYWPII